MIVKLLTEYDLEFLSLKGGSSGQHLSKCQIVGNLMPQLIYFKTSARPLGVV